MNAIYYMSTQKQLLGQYYTKNYAYILQNMTIPPDITHIVEPFAGNGDLLEFMESSKYTITCYDIDPKLESIIKQDTLENPPNYENSFIITNPPYLAKNKSPNKTIYRKYSNVDDLYKCFIKNLTTNKCQGGIIIVPLNFWSSIRNADIQLREDFLKIYEVLNVNIFEEQVFDDTTTTVCSFKFILKSTDNESVINITVYPSGKVMHEILNHTNNFMIGGSIYKLPIHGTYKITRLTSKNQESCNTNILVKCIDDNENSKIGLSMVDDKDIFIDKTPNLSSRTYASLIIEPAINLERQKKLVIKFNTFLKNYRNKYNSLFLTNYRESNTNLARKRISFDLVYLIVEYLLDADTKYRIV
jgi:hypothetical protein